MENTRTNRLMIKITGVLDILICLLLCISSLYKGGFYKIDSLFINLVLCALGLVCLGVKLFLNIKDNKVITKSKLCTTIDITVLGIAIAYFLPILFGTDASTESAIFELTRYVNLAIVYFIARSSKNPKIYVNSFVFMAVIVGILGVDEITFRGFEEILNKYSMGYLEESNNRISSTLQYANITALVFLIASGVLQNKLVRNIKCLRENESIGLRLLAVFETLGSIFLGTTVILTGSRMNILMFVLLGVLHIWYQAKKKDYTNILTVLIIEISAFMLVAKIDGYILSQEYIKVLLLYLLVFVLSVIYISLIDALKGKVNINLKNITIDKKYRLPVIAVSVIIFIVLAILAILPCDLKLNSKNDKSIEINRNIYGSFEGKYDIFFDIDFEGNGAYHIILYEIDNDFNKNEIKYLDYTHIKDGKYKSTIEVSENIQRLQLMVKATNAKVRINEFKVEDKTIALSYLFLPDNLVFRIKDTLTKDSNNLLRLEYYKDSFKLFLKSPLFGHGGEGFKARYQEVQTKYYVSSECHSVPFQILVETGLVGFVVYIVMVVTTYRIIFSLLKGKRENAVAYLLIFTVYNITSVFDLVFSYGIMINIFGVIIGIIVNEYKNGYITKEDEYKLDNKSELGMLKVAVLSMSFMALCVITIHSFNMYKASMIILPQESDEELSLSYERVGLLEEKVKLDKHNAAYISDLISEYKNHIYLLNNIYITTAEEQDRETLKIEMYNYLAKEKELIDNLIEYEYYNKYAIEMAARCYFENYLDFSNIYHYNFKDKEVAYVFYVGYAIKLTKRLGEIGPVNKVALEAARTLYEKYIPIVEKHSMQISSDMLLTAAQDMKNELEQIKNKLD
ncbi:MAG: O-antigen ligase family protein [Clostridia bacterium]|nr:O-antigen ligase family protein [Clostridia bacterium]